MSENGAMKFLVSTVSSKKATIPPLRQRVPEVSPAERCGERGLPAVLRVGCTLSVLYTAEAPQKGAVAYGFGDWMTHVRLPTIFLDFTVS